MWHSIKISIYWIFYFFALDTIYRYMVPHDMYIPFDILVDEVP